MSTIDYEDCLTDSLLSACLYTVYVYLLCTQNNTISVWEVINCHPSATTIRCPHQRRRSSGESAAEDEPFATLPGDYNGDETFQIRHLVPFLDGFIVPNCLVQIKAILFYYKEDKGGQFSQIKC